MSGSTNSGSNLLPILGMGTDLLGGVIGGISSAIQGRRTRKHQKEMYRESVKDNRENWMMQNAYNSPQAQMQRLKEAGLNPNLVYGNDAVATGDTIQSGQTGGYSPPRSEQWIPDGLVMGMYQMQQMQAQTNLTKEKIESENLNQRLTAVTTTIKELQVEYDQARNEVQKATIKTQIDTANAALNEILESIRLKSAQTENVTIGSQKMKQDIDIQAKDAILRWQQGELSLVEARARIQNIKADTRKKGAELGQIYAHTENLKMDTQLKKLEAELAEKGISKTDGFITQQLKTVFEGSGNAVRKAWNAIWDYVDKFSGGTGRMGKNYPHGQ